MASVGLKLFVLTQRLLELAALGQFLCDEPEVGPGGGVFLQLFEHARLHTGDKDDLPPADEL